MTRTTVPPNRQTRTFVLSSVLLAALVLAPPQPASAAAEPAAPATAPAAGPKFTNRLAKEKSPYLLQHAHNPVDWFPWGPEAFEKARKEDKPIFLSVGYSTCHWCHVMERESFENEDVAKLINDNFVPVKVDREERPDVDRTYMAFVQATTGGGGWPMTVFLTPDGKPFFGATYFPPEDTDQVVGLKTVLPRVSASWKTDHEKVVRSADWLAAGLKAATAMNAGDARDDLPGLPAMTAAYGRYAATFDKAHGGFDAAPKFPEPVTLNFLLHYARRAGKAADGDNARDMALQTLRAMAAGGMYDHLGGGFHRYSTDERWFLPHFEKMLYDQGQLAGLYLDAYQITHEPPYADVARRTLDYVLRDLTGPEGQFYSAEDADSAADPARPDEKHEGAFYVWRAEEIDKALGPDAAAVFDYCYGVEPAGNVARDPRREFTGRNVLFAAHTADEAAKKFGKSAGDVEKGLADARAKLLAARAARPRPHRDDKALAAWNGLAVSAFARAGQVLQEPRYAEAAVRAAAFVRDRLYDPNTHVLYRSYRDGRADVPGFLDDYANTIQSLLDLYETTLDIRWLKLALDLQAKQDELFWDKDAGGYYTTADGDDGHVLLRMKDDQESAEPAGNSTAVRNLLRLAHMTDDKAMREKADRTLRLYAGRLKAAPTTLPQMLVGVDLRLDKPRQIVLAGDPAAPGVRAMLKEVYARYLPNAVLLSADGGEGQRFLSERLDFIKDVAPVGGKPTAYVCENYACQLPTNDLATFARQLDGGRPSVQRQDAKEPRSQEEEKEQKEQNKK